MAPDRRFGLPHPLDADPSEDSSPRKSGLWESFKRALGSVPGDPPAADEKGVRPPSPPLPVAPPPASSLRSPGPIERESPAPEAPPMGSAEISRHVPFLDDLPFEPVASASAGLPPVVGAPIDEPGETAAPAEPSGSPEPSESPTRGPRLARGLASFSRDNARREKKFAHLLRDEPGADDKRPDPPRRRR